MKGNDGTGNCVERDEWCTSNVLFRMLDRQYCFDFDCCSVFENSKCEDYSDEFELVESYELLDRVCWMNPPFSKAYEMFEHFFNVVDKGVAIYRCDNMETKVWQDVILKNATWIFIPKGRIRYKGIEGKGSRFPSALIGFNVDTPKGLNGVVLQNIKSKHKKGGQRR